MEKLLKTIYAGKVECNTWNGEEYFIGVDEVTLERLLYDFKGKRIKLVIEELSIEEEE